jgi:hypothetical protein
LLGRTGVVALGRSVLDGAPGAVLIAVARVLDEFFLGLLEPLGFPLAGFGQRALCFVRPVDRGLVGAGRAA